MNQSYIAEICDRQVWLQDSIFNIWLDVYPVDSRKACCEVCNNTVQTIAELFSQMWVAQSFELQRPDLESL